MGLFHPCEFRDHTVPSKSTAPKERQPLIAVPVQAEKSKSCFTAFFDLFASSKSTSTPSHTSSPGR